MAVNDLRIENLDVALFRVPPAGTWIDATHHIEHLEFVLVELHAAGQTGIGWTYTLGHGGLAGPCMSSSAGTVHASRLTPAGSTSTSIRLSLRISWPDT